MSGTIIYVVVAYGGAYDDAWNSNVCAFLEESAAQLHAEEMKKKNEDEVARWYRVCAGMQKWSEAHVHPIHQPAFRRRENKEDHLKLNAAIFDYAQEMNVHRSKLLEAEGLPVPTLDVQPTSYHVEELEIR